MVEKAGVVFLTNLIEAGIQDGQTIGITCLKNRGGDTIATVRGRGGKPETYMMKGDRLAPLDPIEDGCLEIARRVLEEKNA